MNDESVATLLGLLIQCGLPLGLLLFALVVGRWLEQRHFASIRTREAATRLQPAVTFEQLDPDAEVEWSRLAIGSVVVSVNHFKKFLGGFRLLFGGELRSYASVIDLGRREALLRMKRSCPGADLYLNTRLETSTINNQKGKAWGCVELVAYGTAVKLRKGEASA